MDLSKLKIEIYDFLGLILPGLVAVCELWILVEGWSQAALSLANLGGTAFAILLIVSFGLGHLVQELGDALVKRARGKRFFRRGRDKYWLSEEATPIKALIADEIGHSIESPDEAFDYCLTNIGGQFPKRDIFLATSDLCRSLVVLAILAIAPLVRVIIAHSSNRLEFFLLLTASLSVLLVILCLSWTRMIRFRELSEVTVFRIYSATRRRPDVHQPRFE